MKILPVALLSALLCQAASAAITITVSPGETGTRFSLTQTAANPFFATDAVTGGVVAGIPLASGAVIQSPSLATAGGELSASLGTLSDITGSGSSISSLYVLGGGIENFTLLLWLSPSLNIGSGQTHQLQMTSTAGGETALGFENFLPGVYVTNDVVFGQVTTVVVPEPSTMMAASLLALPGLLRRRRY